MVFTDVTFSDQSGPKLFQNNNFSLWGYRQKPFTLTYISLPLAASISIHFHWYAKPFAATEGPSSSQGKAISAKRCEHRKKTFDNNDNNNNIIAERTRIFYDEL